MSSSVRLATDFDNTVVDYGELFMYAARAIGVGILDPIRTKGQLRDFVRSLPDGERMWQRIQAEVYGRLMPRAKLVEGFEEVVAECRKCQIPVFIISHKTEVPAGDRGVKLRAAAMEWMAANRFFDPLGLDFSRDEIFFEETRLGKVARIRELGCTHFVDDMMEVLSEAKFPPTVTPIHLAREPSPPPPAGVFRFTSWREIGAYLFG